MNTEAPEQESTKTETASTSWCWRWCKRLFGWTEKLLLLALVASSFSSLLFFDYFGAGMFLTYAPRTIWLAFAVFSFLIYVIVFRFRTALLVAICVLLLMHDSPWGGGAKSVPNDALTLLSFNTHYSTGEEIAALCDEHDVDLLSLQEIHSNQHEKFIAPLDEEYVFFSADRQVDFKHKNDYVFSCLIGIRRDLLATDPNDVEVHTAITEYRTLAVRAELESGPLCLVNVHTAKPIASGYGLKFLVKITPMKATMHREEHQALQSWLAMHADETVIVAGDFNAPANTCNLRLPGFKNAQRVCGKGLHLTFPGTYPLFGIDHVLGNDAIEFYSYDVLNTGLSDHRAQLAKFRIDGNRK